MVNNVTIEYDEALMAGLQPAEIIAQFTAIIQGLISQNQSLSGQVEKLTAQIAWFQRQLFGAKSEKFVPVPEGTALLPGFEAAPEAAPVEPAQHVESHERKPREKFGWNEIPADLPREELVIDVPEAERAGMELIGYEISERVARRETRFFVKVIKRAKYADKADATRGVITAPAAGDFLDSISGKTKFDISFISGVISDKVENHLPLYRQAEIMKREGLPIHRSSLCSLFAGAAQQLKVLWGRVNELLMQREIIHADETPVNMLDPGKGKCKKAYLWCGLSGIGPPLAVFHFALSRSQIVAEKLFGSYSGTIIRDAYVGYDTLEADFAACWAHVRRKFLDVFNAGYVKAEPELKLIRNLYQIEAEAKLRAEKKNTETALFQERKVARRASAKLVKEFFELCREQLVNEVPSSPLYNAINYALKLEEQLSLFLKNPKLNIDNNPAENVIRPIALGRKNWLFAGSEPGGQHLAIMQSMAATCKANSVNFRAWMEDVLVRISTTPAAEIDSLLPHLWKQEIK